MRPIKLTMSAFGPYADVTEIDFSALGTSGVYLVCGDTGAGKTMIFDGICFALFGEASGDSRGGARSTLSMRSDYADPTSQTYVELAFEYQGKTYRIKRNPEYERAKGRGSGTTRQKPNAEIELPDGRVISGVRKVNSQLEELLGIDSEQFKQIVMLAQGEFRKLLTADTETRQTIFRKLFGTQRYEMLQEKLAEESRKLERDNTQIKTHIAAYADQAILPAESPEAAELAQRRQAGSQYGAWLAEVLRRQISADTPAYKQFEDQVDDLRLKWSEAKALLNQAQNRPVVEREKQTLEQEIAQLEIELPTLKAAFEEQQSHDDERTAATERAAVIEGTFGKYETAAQAGAQYVQAQVALKQALQAQKAALETKEQTAQALAAIAKDAATFDGAEVKLAEAKTALAQASAAYENAQRALQSARDTVNLHSSLQKAAHDAQQPYQTKVNELKAAEELHSANTSLALELQQRQRAGRAGLLAASLQEGLPCPVCGSLQHPKPAPMSDAIPSDEAIDKAAAAAALSEKNATQLSLEAERLRTMLEQARTALQEFVTTHGDETAVNQAMQEAQAAFERASQNYKGAQSNEQAAQKAVKSMHEMQAKQTQAAEALREAETALTAADADVSQKTQACNLAKDRLENLKLDLEFGALDDAKREAERLRTHAQKLFAARQAAEQAHNSAASQLATKKELLKAKQKQLDETPNVNVEETQAAMQAFHQQADQLKARSAIVKSRIDANTSCLANLEKALAKAGDIEERYGRVKLLADVATGNLAGQTKVRFEAYVQAIYFDKVIAAANERLKLLTSGQFQLVRHSEGAGMAKAGLGLYVIDAFTGRARDASSLSGGESFQASLCLALGLSDIVQEHAGGIEFDTMFVDEGFGSLDQGALGNAISLLSDLSGETKLVGIISHVEDLKANIPKKILVTKSRSGSSVSLEL